MRVDWSSLEQRQPHVGVRVAAVDGAGFTASRYELGPGARFPRHRHGDEKVLVVLSGELIFTVGSEVTALKPGDVLLVASNEPHEGLAGASGALFLALAVPRRTSSHAIEYV